MLENTCTLAWVLIVLFWVSLDVDGVDILVFGRRIALSGCEMLTSSELVRCLMEIGSGTQLKIGLERLHVSVFDLVTSSCSWTFLHGLLVAKSWENLRIRTISWFAACGEHNRLRSRILSWWDALVLCRHLIFENTSNHVLSLIVELKHLLRLIVCSSWRH